MCLGGCGADGLRLFVVGFLLFVPLLCLQEANRGKFPAAGFLKPSSAGEEATAFCTARGDGGRPLRRHGGTGATRPNRREGERGGREVAATRRHSEAGRRWRGERAQRASMLRRRARNCCRRPPPRRAAFRHGGEVGRPGGPPCSPQPLVDLRLPAQREREREREQWRCCFHGKVAPPPLPAAAATPLRLDLARPARHCSWQGRRDENAKYRERQGSLQPPSGCLLGRLVLDQQHRRTDGGGLVMLLQARRREVTTMVVVVA